MSDYTSTLHFGIFKKLVKNNSPKKNTFFPKYIHHDVKIDSFFSKFTKQMINLRTDRGLPKHGKRRK